MVWASIFLADGEQKTYKSDTMIEAIKFACDNYHDKATSMSFVLMENKKGGVPDG